MDICIARGAVESEGLRRSMVANDSHWEAGVVVAQHRMRRSLSDEAVSRRGVENIHADLHRALRTHPPETGNALRFAGAVQGANGTKLRLPTSNLSRRLLGDEG